MECKATVSVAGGLPSQADIVAEFGLFETGTGCNVQVSDAEHVLCGCRGCQRWKDFLNGHRHDGGGWPQYEVLSREFVTMLAEYLHGRALLQLQSDAPSSPAGPPEAKKRKTCAGPLRVLEIGAGDGRLTHHLVRALHRIQHQERTADDQNPPSDPSDRTKSTKGGASGPRVVVRASDSGLRGLQTASPVGALVEMMDFREALELHRPHVVICCWQPMGVDWTKEIRATSSLLEYLLIGETGDGICGRPWETWGFSFACDASSSSSSSDENENSEDAKAERERLPVAPRPYHADGFDSFELPALSAVQICRTDERWSSCRHSHTVSFRRGHCSGGKE